MNKKEQISNNDGSNGPLGDIRKKIEESRLSVAVSVNAALTMLYWRIGKQINKEVLKGDRANYGEETVYTLSRQLVVDHGNGFSSKNLRHKIRFAEEFPDQKIVSILWRLLICFFITAN